MKTARIPVPVCLFMNRLDAVPEWRAADLDEPICFLQHKGRSQTSFQLDHLVKSSTTGTIFLFQLNNILIFLQYLRLLQFCSDQTEFEDQLN